MRSNRTTKLPFTSDQAAIPAVIVLVILVALLWGSPLALPAPGATPPPAANQGAQAGTGALAGATGIAAPTPPAVAPTVTPSCPTGYTCLRAALAASWGVQPTSDPASMLTLAPGQPWKLNGGPRGDRCPLALDHAKDTPEPQVWVTCTDIGQADAPPPTQRQAQVANTPVPPPPCFQATGINGTFNDCGWQLNQATADAFAGPALPAKPEPTVCAESDDGRAIGCAIGASTAKVYANNNAQATAQARPNSGLPLDAQRGTP